MKTSSQALFLGLIQIFHSWILPRYAKFFFPFHPEMYHHLRACSVTPVQALVLGSQRQYISSVKLVLFQLQFQCMELKFPNTPLMYFSMLDIHGVIVLSKLRNSAIFWSSGELYVLCDHIVNFHRSGNLTRIIKDGFQLQSWLCPGTRVIKFTLLHGHPILAGNNANTIIFILY